MIWWPRNNWELLRPGSNNNCIMHPRWMMCSQVIPKKHTMIICSINQILFNASTDVIHKIKKDNYCCTCSRHTSNPMARTLNTAAHLQWNSWITWFDFKKDSNVHTMWIMTIFPDFIARRRQCKLAVGLCQGNAKLINIHESPAWNLNNFQGRETIPECPDTKLDAITQTLICIDWCLFICASMLYQMPVDGVLHANVGQKLIKK